jgi:apolipoprotein D and lipocalin family protein
MSSAPASFSSTLLAVADKAGGFIAALRRPPVGNGAVPEPVGAVDLARYAGIWFEYARYENGFERDCEAVTAQYTPLADGGIQVVNRCRKGGLDGPVKLIKGKAKVLAGSGNAKLKVSFFGPFFLGDYWVLEHDPDYAWSIVGEPSGRFLWVLTRQSAPSAATVQVIETGLRNLGYDTGMIRKTRHGPTDPAVADAAVTA